MKRLSHCQVHQIHISLSLQQLLHAYACVTNKYFEKIDHFELILAGPTPNFKQISNQQSTFKCTIAYMYFITMKSQNF